ncbi:rhodanese-related sulfurtransferase [Paroceanicella profunda]|uniref:tRNA uridine(34) hydroxylase n=1 Tax=Paroceanicella profunda TaxID=2579971 RepID=A0A5B8FX07_9RHOB|nr:rhodanese-related sulfurtransferase [Paroceanicella profunda]QDL90972.1 rhodanese-related sulfurtransferase [Paroceanicella profunda]
MSGYVVAALYQFTRFERPEALRPGLEECAARTGTRGTLLLAREGINGTIAGTRGGIDTMLAHIRALPGCAQIEVKESHAAERPFGRMKVRLKREIVTLGAEADPTQRVGTYVAPEEWNALIAAEDVVTIDTRNGYEVAIGSFEGALDPGTKSFRDFPAWWDANRERIGNRRVAMFCTGGIRCEKASSWLLGQGVRDVFHLKGGILKYLETVPEAESRWQGECFVFDGRVAVGHGLAEGSHSLCHACRRPLSAADRASEQYAEGISCPQCIDEYTDADRARFAERQRQVRLAACRGARHLGGGDGTGAGETDGDG